MRRSLAIREKSWSLQGRIRIPVLYSLAMFHNWQDVIPKQFSTLVTSIIYRLHVSCDLKLGSDFEEAQNVTWGDPPRRVGAFGCTFLRAP